MITSRIAIVVVETEIGIRIATEVRILIYKLEHYFIVSLVLHYIYR